MKRHHEHEIDFEKKIVVVTKKFMEESSQYGSNEFRLMTTFAEMGFKVVLQARKKKKLKDGEKPRLTYKMMEKYIKALDVAEEKLKDFEAVRESAKNRTDRVRYVNEWFRSNFPHYDDIPLLNKEHRFQFNTMASDSKS